MRGKVACSSSLILFKGIIPAHAGKSPNLSDKPQGNWDHPRSCGEKFGVALRGARFQGPSPLMRGKGAYLKAEEEGHGIIPAHAGKRRAEE